MERKPTVTEFWNALTQAQADDVDILDQDEVIAHCDAAFPAVSSMLQSINSFTYYRLIDKYETAHGR
jgi:hypothetical protein